MSSTSITNPQSMNLYAYAQNNPVDFTDPSGLFAQEAITCVPILRSDGEGHFWYAYDCYEILVSDGRGHEELEEYSGGGSGQSVCNIGDLLIPEGVSIAKNISIAESHAFSSNLSKTFFPLPSLVIDGINTKWFYNQVQSAEGRVDDVKNGNSWDYKQLDQAGIKSPEGSKYESFGNFNYGVTGAAMGWNERTLLREAGRANLNDERDPERRKKMMEEWGTPGNIADPLGGTKYFGDEPKDQKWIKRGYAYYTQKCGNK